MKGSRIILFVLSILLFFKAFTCDAQNTLIFKNINVDNGLPQNTVLSVLQDSKGYLWVGTYDGLSKFNGLEFKVYKNDPLNAQTISNNKINKLLKDKYNRLWIGTAEGLNLFDPETENFTRFSIAGLKLNYNVLSITQDNMGTIWVGTDKGLIYIRPKNSDSSANRFNQPQIFSSAKTECLFFDSDNDLWICSGGSAKLYHPSSGKFYPVPIPLAQDRKFSNTVIRSITQDKDGGYWIGTDSKGLFYFNKSGSCINYDQENGLLSNTVRSIFIADKRTVWVGTKFNPKLMKPQLMKVSKGPAQSFSVVQENTPHFDSRWHYHSEMELMHIKAGNGILFVGDHSSKFKTGDIVLIGANLPHYLKFDDCYFQDDCIKSVEVTAVHFQENFCGEEFLRLPENKIIRTLLDKCARGIKLIGDNSTQLAEIIGKLLRAEGTNRILLLIEALHIFACNNSCSLSSLGFNQATEISMDSRINKIYEYSYANFKNNIQLEEIAAVVNVCPSSFCRYFKARTKKTYSQFMIELRIGYACKLLIENNVIIKQLCYESGFNNFASFHKYFKRITGKSPLNFQRDFLQLVA